MVRYNKTIVALDPRAISPASGEQIVMSPSLKGNNCILTAWSFKCGAVNTDRHIHVPVRPKEKYGR